MGGAVVGGPESSHLPTESPAESYEADDAGNMFEAHRRNFWRTWLTICKVGLPLHYNHQSYN